MFEFVSWNIDKITPSDTPLLLHTLSSHLNWQAACFQEAQGLDKVSGDAFGGHSLFHNDTCKAAILVHADSLPRLAHEPMSNSIGCALQ